MRNHHYLRNALTLGTSLTALFLLVRCSVPGRDYSLLGIDSTGNGGASGAGDVLHSSGGQAGLGGLGDAGSDQGGTAGAPPVAPIPCDIASILAGRHDAGSEDAGTDAGSDDAGTTDAGSDDTACACVDGFIRAVDTDGDGDGSRACSLAPGLDCDDADPTVTHNSCGGCTTLPNTVGEDCGDCGAYACDGPNAVICASKPEPLEDPDCRCLAGLIVARDTDGDGQGTRLCEQNPGIDCNDGNGSFVTNECGGCADLPGAVGGACNECGVYACNGGALACVPNPAAGGHCTNDKNRQTCNANGFWGNDADCANVCYQGNCEICTPGTFLCGTPYMGSEILYKCLVISTSSSYGINWTSWDSCLNGQGCNATTGTCTGYLFLPRDRTFDVVPSLRDGVPWHDILNTASDSDYG